MEEGEEEYAGLSQEKGSGDCSPKITNGSGD
jgi:hypothetical protein